MPVDPYTHDFSYWLGDGGPHIVGEVEFDKDKKVSYRIKEWSEPCQHELIVAFAGFIERAKLRYDEWGGIKLVKIQEKGFTEPI